MNKETERTSKQFVFDLHSHTTHSDGELGTIEILKKAQENKIGLFSITDHSSVGAYLDMKNFDIKEYYTGKILTGCEMDSTFDGKAIEILAYGIDVDKLNEELKKLVSFEWLKNKRDTVLEKLKIKAKKLGLTFDEDFKLTNYAMGESGTFFRHLKQFTENKKAFDDKTWNSSAIFFRNEVTNKNSPFFVDYSVYYKNPKQIIDIIHQCGGKAFLAHFYIYSFENPQKVLDDLILPSNFDGIECYYPTFSESEVRFLLDYCKQHNLLMSGGSDFHGNFRPKNKLSIPNENLPASSDILHWTKPLIRD